MSVTRPRGTNDVLPDQSYKWQIVEAKIREICHNFGYQELRTPIFEHTELFERGIGETTDIVEKEMYTFIDRGNRSMTLRPEGTAPVVRAFLENKLYAQAMPAKVYYLGAMFRYERPQAGRYRQFTQFGVEALGSSDPMLDVEMITLPIKVYQACGLEGFKVHINSIGCPDCRPAYRKALQDKFLAQQEAFCMTCQGRIERNPLRVLDCKVKECQSLLADIPLVTESLCKNCGDHFAQVRTYLDQLDVKYVINPKLVRGFDYYTKTVFEIIVPTLGSQNAIGGGGRYDGLVAECGGEPQPAVGFAVGLERVLLSLAQKETTVFQAPKPDLFLAQFGGATKDVAIALAHKLRDQGLWVELDYMGKSLRAQMKVANKLNCLGVIVIGEDEVAQNRAKLRKMSTSEEIEIDLNHVEQVEQAVVKLREGQVLA